MSSQPAELAIAVELMMASTAAKEAMARLKNGCRRDGLHGMLRPMKCSWLVILAVLSFAGCQAVAGAASGEILWSNELAKAADLAGSEGAGRIATEFGGGPALFFALTNATDSIARSFTLPVNQLRGRFVFVGAEIKQDGDRRVAPNAFREFQFRIPSGFRHKAQGCQVLQLAVKRLRHPDSTRIVLSPWLRQGDPRELLQGKLEFLC